MKDLNENAFVRKRLLSGDTSSFRKYLQMTVGEQSSCSLLRYEIITCLFGALPGAIGYALRSKTYPFLFQRIGKGVVFGKHITIRHPGNITIGDRVIIDDYAVIDGRGADEDGLCIGDNTIIGRSAIVQSKVGPLHIGANCNIGTACVIVSQGGVKIEDWVAIAGGCEISGGIFKPNPDPNDETAFLRSTKGGIAIGERCFIGGNSMILDGVTIGAHSMIGTGSVVMADLPEQSIFMPRPGLVVGKISP